MTVQKVIYCIFNLQITRTWMIQAALKIVTKPVLIRRARVVQIASSDPPKKRHFLLGCLSFVLKYRVYYWRIRRFHLKKFGLPGKIVHRKPLPLGEHFLLLRAPTFHENLKRNQLKCPMYKKISLALLIQVET